MSRVLLTGSNGFIGTHVSSHLSALGYDVVGVGRRSSPVARCSSYIQCDLASQNGRTDLAKELAKCDVVVHLAADMRKAPYEIEVLETNTKGTQLLLELCEEMEVDSFVQLSSLPVIGHPTCVPIKEDHPVKPPTIYHLTKHVQELLANYAAYTHGLRTVSLRICSPIGAGVNPQTIFPTFVRRAKTEEDIVLYGKGTRVQTYIHVNDIAAAVEACITSRNACGVYNLAGPEPISNIDLAYRVVEVMGSKSRIVFSGHPDACESEKWVVSTSKLEADTGFIPEVGIEEMILDLADHC